jgi:membrane protein
MKTLRATWRFVVDVALRWYNDGVGDLAAGVTFWIVMSLPASILALLAALGPLERILSISFSTEIEQDVLEFIGRVFTSEGSSVQEAISALFGQNPNSGLLTVSLAVAIWSVSRGFSGLIRALDDIYEVVDGRTWYHTRVVALLLGFGSMLVSVPLVMVERLVWDSIADGPLERVGRGLVALAVLVAWASMIYHFGPAQRSRWRHDLPGAMTAAVMWWLLSTGFGWYVSLTSGANDVTAAIGAGLLALTWLWMAAQVLLIGGLVNFLYGRNRQIARNRPTWGINDKITGEWRRIQERGDDVPAPTGQVPATGGPRPSDRGRRGEELPDTHPAADEAAVPDGQEPWSSASRDLRGTREAQR